MGKKGSSLVERQTGWLVFCLFRCLPLGQFILGSFFTLGLEFLCVLFKNYCVYQLILLTLLAFLDFNVYLTPWGFKTHLLYIHYNIYINVILKFINLFSILFFYFTIILISSKLVLKSILVTN